MHLSSQPAKRHRTSRFYSHVAPPNHLLLLLLLLSLDLMAGSVNLSLRPPAMVFHW